METHSTLQSVAAPSADNLLRPSAIFRDSRMVVVGGTGFLGKVWLAMLLEAYPDIGKIVLLVRPKADQSPEQRFWAQIVGSPVFDPLRKKLGDGFERFMEEKIEPVAGDVVEPYLGLDESLIERLAGQTHAVVNVAGVVDFNPPLDEALDVNAFGVSNLVALAKRLGAPVMHTSTCYVAGYRSGLVDEVDPREIPFPRAAGEKLIGEELPRRKLDRSHWDPQREIDECMDLVKQARHRCEDAFRQSDFLDQAKENLRRRGEPCRGSALDDELAKVRRKFTEARLIDAGMERAKFWGWSNIYTYTKSIGEQVLAASGVPYTIVRPAVIESAIEFPFAGWNEGINTSAPFIYMALKGQMQFPGGPGVHLDIIPVDMVSAGMIASLAELLEGTQKPVYQYGTTDTNGCLMKRYLELIGLYKRKQVFAGKRTKAFDFVSQYFEPTGLSTKQFDQHGARAISNAMQSVGGLLEKTAVGPVASAFKTAGRALKKAAAAEAKTAEIQELFIPFTAESDWVFSCANTRAAFDRMPDEERSKLVWYPETIDWRAWLYDVHMPGLEKWVVPLIDERLRREMKPLRAYDHLLDLLDEMAERHDHTLALSRLEEEGLSRFSFSDLVDLSYVVADRLRQLGVQRGDAVLIAGQNQPAWPVVYFGILRRGAIAVPVDAALEAEQLANLVRASAAKVAVWDQHVEDKGGAGARELSPGLVTASLAGLAEASKAEVALAKQNGDFHRPDPEDLASIIYTSGTTGQPKGVMLTHQNFTSLLAALRPIFPLNPSDRVLSVLPLHHTLEFTCGLLLPLSCGARVAYLRELNPEGLSEGLSRVRPTGMVGVPALWQTLERRILARVDELGPMAKTAFEWEKWLTREVGKRSGINLGKVLFSSVHSGLGGSMRHLISGGAALPKETAETFSALGLPVSEGYGLTEAAPVLTVSKGTVRARPGQVGKPVPGVEIKIDNPNDEGVGEILARGPNIMRGYAGDEEATKKVLGDGWLRTGDLGKLDKRDRLVIVGRDKDVIVGSSGENVYPDDVEALLGQVDGVRELAIVGLPDGRGGEKVACLAVIEPPAEDVEESAEQRDARHREGIASLSRACEALPRVARPSLVHLYESDLPRTATRKVKRPEVREILERLVAATTPQEGDDGIDSRVRQAVAALSGRSMNDIRSNMSLAGDLGFDSLTMMEVGVAVEARIGRALSASDLAKCETIEDLEKLAGDTAKVRVKGASDVDEDRIEVPQPVAEGVKEWLGKFQIGFYERVMRPKITGRAFIPHNRNTLVVSNHASHLDMGLVKFALGSYGKGLVSLAAQDYFFEGNRWRRAYIENFTNLAAFDRKSGLRQGLRQAGEILERGDTILVFPEGTRSTDGALQEFRPAIGHLALVHKVDILPVYLEGTYEAMPKGRRFPVRRDIGARIGPPLRVDDLLRLTEGMKFSQACRRVADLAHKAVDALKHGGVFDLATVGDLSQVETPDEERRHPVVSLIRELETKFVTGKIEQPITYYLTLGNDAQAKWTVRVDAERCETQLGKPDGQADCVLKTSPEIFMKIVREAYTPSPMEFMTGAVKSNDISLLQTFQKVFNLA